jgi:hypothetical protein
MSPDHKQKIDTIFTEVCCGDQNAFHACWAVYQFLHVIDDLVDRDQEVDARTVGLTLVVFTEAVSANPFFQANRDVLLGTFRTGVMEWIDSEAWRKRSDIKDQMAAEVIKSGYQNFFFQVAYLCGGPAHMNAMSEKHREYCWD